MPELVYQNALWVAPNGSDSNPGTQTRPFKTIQHAIDVASAGTAVMVREGVYNESVHIGARSSYWRLDTGSEQRPFTLVSVDGPGKAVIVGDNPAESTVNITVGHVRVYDFEIRGVQWLQGDNAPIKVAPTDTVADAKSDVIIDGNLITGTGRDGIKAAYVYDLEITNNTFDMTAKEDLIDFVTVWNSKIEYNEFDAVASRAINVKTGSQNIDISNNLIRLENGFGWAGTGIVDIGGDGVTQLSRPPLPSNFKGFEARNVTFEENVVTGDSFYTVKFRGAADSDVKNNLLYGRGPIAVSSERSASPEQDNSRNNLIANNVYRDDMTLSSVASGQGQGLQVYGNRVGDEDDTSFRVGPNKVLSSSLDVLDDPFPYVGSYDIVVRAGGMSTGAKPTFDLVIDDKVIGTRTIGNPVYGSFDESKSSNYVNYTFSYTGRTPEEIAVRFDVKTGSSMNLYVDYIAVNGERFEAEHYSEVTRFDQPGWMRAQWTGLFYDGEMQFNHMYLSPRWPGPKGAAQNPPPDPDPVDPPPADPSDPVEPPTGSDAQRIDVRVGGVTSWYKPEYEVWVDGARIGRGVVDGARQGVELASVPKSAYETDSFVFSGSAPRKVSIVFSNDKGDMAVDYIAVNGTRYESEKAGVYTFDKDGTDIVRTGTEEMYRGGDMTFELSPPASGGRIVVRAAGSGDAQESPTFAVKIDGRTVGQTTIVNPQPFELDASDRSVFRDYAFAYDGGRPGKVEIAFLNDGGSGSAHRDLAVDYVLVDGVRHETEDAVFTSAVTGKRWSGGEFLHTEGVMTYDLV